MAKRIRWSNNERVDVPDLQAATSGGDTAATPGFAEAEARRLTVETVLTKYPAVLEGFRIEVPDQSTNPGEFIVHNAFAYDRAGRILNDESEPDATKSYTLPNPNTQYFVEAEVLMVASDVDARAFWDQTYDNGTQPSGDPQQPGREFALNVSTRMTPQWQIVMPPSVAGFDIDTNPNSTRIPIATLETNGLTQITNITKSFTAQSVLAEDYAAGATSIRVHNTRIFPDTFTLDIIQLLPTPVTESIAVTANDRVNGILTLGVPTANNHFAGQRVRDSSAGAPVFIGENYQPSVVPSSNSEDARPRLFAADEQAGFVALRSPEVSAGYTDTQIATMRDEINALAASVREMRWGGFLDSDSSSIMPTRIGQYAQANSFSTSPRWFEPAGGIQGAKTCTVSVGDGVLSFGDYNANAYPSDADAIQAAINKIAESGATSGTLYIKRASTPYQIAGASITVPAMTGRLTIIGDGDMTEIQMTDAFSAFVLTSTAKAHFENLKITRSGGLADQPGIFAYTLCRLSATRVYVDGIKGIVPLLGSAKLFIDLDGCQVISSGAHADKVALMGYLIGSARNCDFGSSINNASSFAVSLYGDASSAFEARGCRFVTIGVNVTGAIRQDTSTRLSLYECSFDHSGGATAWDAVTVPVSATQTVIDRCWFGAMSGNYALLNAVNVSTVSVTGCRVSYPANGNAVKFVGGSVTIKDCYFTQATAGSTGRAIYFSGGDSVSISNVYIKDADEGIVNYAGTVNGLTIQGVTVNNTLVTAGISGISVTPGTIYECSISDCYVSGLNSGAAPGNNLYGILVAPSTLAEGVSIARNQVTSSSGADNVYGIRAVGQVVGLSISDNTVGGNAPLSLDSALSTMGISLAVNGALAPSDVSICGNKLLNIHGVTDARGIDIAAFNGLSVANNSIKQIGSVVSAGNADGIRFGWDAPAASSYQEFATITGNNIRLVECAAGGPVACGIRGGVGGARLSISNNIISDCRDTLGGMGIRLDGNNIGGSYIRSLSIVGNTIVPTPGGVYSFVDCINVDGLIFADDEGDITINSNTLRHFSGSGIRVFPVLGDELYNLTISGNTIRTDIACVAGIAVGKVIGFAITGNTVALTLPSQNQHGIYMPEAGTSTGTISSNSIKVIDPALNYYGIYADATAFCIVGNLIYTGTNAVPNNQCIYLSNGQNSYCAILSNQFQVGSSAPPFNNPNAAVYPPASIYGGAPNYGPGHRNSGQAVDDTNNQNTAQNLNFITDAP